MKVMASYAPPEGAPRLPAGLLARVRADPMRAPEHLAQAAAERHAPAAARWAAATRDARAPERLARDVKREHARWARYGGAATGVGGIYTIVPDLALLLWIQSRMVFFIAGAYGFDPLDRMRPAELLVLWELYDRPGEAREALDGAGVSVAGAYVSRQVEGGRDTATARLVRAAANHTGRRFAGKLIPGVAILFNAVGNERATRALADDTIAFYGG